jgi:hypothetical protein
MGAKDLKYIFIDNMQKFFFAVAGRIGMRNLSIYIDSEYRATHSPSWLAWPG